VSEYKLLKLLDTQNIDEKLFEETLKEKKIYNFFKIDDNKKNFRYRKESLLTIEEFENILHND
jgi:hypothetical protein